MEEKLNRLFIECIDELNKIGIDILDEKQYGKIEILISKRNNKRYGCCKQEFNRQRLNRNDYIIPAYHMNKQHWNTIILSDKCDTDLIKELLEQSYELTKK